MAKSYRIEWSRTAINDLDDIIDFIAAEGNVIAAMGLYEKLINKVNSLIHYPKRGRIPPEFKDLGLQEYRELILTPYRILFRIDQQIVVLLGILDGRRDLEELLFNRILQ